MKTKKNIKWFLSKISGQDENYFTWEIFFSNILMYGCMAFMFLFVPVMCFMTYNLAVAGVVAVVEWSSIGITLMLFIWWQNRYMKKLKTVSPKPNDKKQDEEVDMDIYMRIIDILYKDGKDIDFKAVNKIYDDIVKAIGKEKAREILKFNLNADTNTTETNTNTDTDSENIELRGLSFINKQFVVECLNNKRQNSFHHAIASFGTNGFWFPTECKYIDYSKVYTSDKHKLCVRDSVLLMAIKLISNGYYKKGERIFNPKFLRSELGIRSDVTKEVFEALLDANIINRHFEDYYVLSNNVDEWYCSYKLRNLYKLGYLNHKDYKGKDTKWVGDNRIK
jgi:hypothetical protein